MLEEIAQISATANSGSVGCEDIIRCVFNLSGTDVKALYSLDENKDSTAIEIAEKIGKDRSTAHRSLEKLVSCGLTTKERQPGESRGYICAYRSIPRKIMYAKTQERLDACYCKIREVLSDP